MKKICALFKNKFKNDDLDRYMAWERALADAHTPAHRSEINAIFSRHI